MHNAKEDGGELISSSKKKLNLCKHSAIHFQSLAYFSIALSIVAPPAVLVDGHRFQSLSSLDVYIDTFEHGKE